ncbi:MAG TPA: DUF4337 domain-containing protein [Xanthobacteraceae bacterium]|jgi:hypothetical protein|nr:DUF4337 domain-containing protein [Xanthobacteraceae bacterium]
MSEISEAIEKAKEGEKIEIGEGFNRKVALVIAILALFLSFSETLGKGAQTEVTTKNIEASDLWGFFQAKNIRMTQITTAAEEMTVAAAGATDPAAKDAMQKQIDAWKKNVERIDTEPKTGRKDIEEQAKHAEEERDLSTAKYHHYELSSAAFQVGIVLASAAVITGMAGLAWLAGLLGVVGLGLLALGLFAPHAVPFIASL